MEPPKWLSTEAKRHYRKLAPLIKQWDESTRENLAVLSDCYSTYVRAAQQLDKEGLTISNNGLVRAHPASRIKGDASAQIRALSKLLGLCEVNKEDANTDEVDAFFKD